MTQKKLNQKIPLNFNQIKIGKWYEFKSKEKKDGFYMFVTTKHHSGGIRHSISGYSFAAVLQNPSKITTLEAPTDHHIYMEHWEVKELSETKRGSLYKKLLSVMKKTANTIDKSFGVSHY